MTTTKTLQARERLTKWHHDHTGETPEPSPNDVIRAFASIGWAGHSRTPRNMYPGMLRKDYTRMYGGTSYLSRTVGEWEEVEGVRKVNHRDGTGWHEVPTTYRRLNVERTEKIDTERAAKLLERYLRFYKHMTEVAPQWVATACTHWADNSIEVTDTAHDGTTRTRLVLGAGEFYSNSGCECKAIRAGKGLVSA